MLLLEVFCLVRMCKVAILPDASSSGKESVISVGTSDEVHATTVVVFLSCCFRAPVLLFRKRFKVVAAVWSCTQRHRFARGPLVVRCFEAGPCSPTDAWCT